MPLAVAAAWFAATESSPITLAGLAAVGMAILGGAGWLLNRRSGEVSRSLGYIDAAQESQSSALAQNRLDLAQARADILELRGQVAQMRVELKDALRHHQECEDARVVLEQQLTVLRAQIEGP